MNDLPDKSKIELIRAGSFDIPELESTILELWIEDKNVSSLYFADGAWHMKISAIGGIVTIEWADFVDIFGEFTKFMTGESELLIRQSKDEK